MVVLLTKFVYIWTSSGSMLNFEFTWVWDQWAQIDCVDRTPGGGHFSGRTNHALFERCELSSCAETFATVIVGKVSVAGGAWSEACAGMRIDVPVAAVPD